MDKMADAGKRRAVFLDRDGTINVEKDYLHRVEEFEFIPGAPDSIRKLKEAGYLVIVVTNQSGVARGYYDIEAVHRLHAHLDAELSKIGAAIDAYYVCPHHPEHGVGDYRCQCDCRKPMPGMLLEAAGRFGIDLASSFLVGDNMSDVDAARNAGCRPVLVTTGHGGKHVDALPENVPVFATLKEAAEAIAAGRL